MITKLNVSAHDCVITHKGNKHKACLNTTEKVFVYISRGESEKCV